MPTLADDYNLRTAQPSMTDLADMVDTFEEILTWTPTYDYNGTSITLNTLNYAEYVKLAGGKLYYVQASMQVTLVGSAAFPTVTLPANMKTGGYKFLPAMVSNNSTPLVFEPCTAVISGNEASILRSGSDFYAAGTCNFYIQVTYFTE
jgi:hypothetical protein